MATYGKLFNINSIMTPDDNGHQRKNRLQHPYRPLQTDVLCGRGKKFINHEGNKTLRALVKQLSPKYNKLDANGKRLLQIEIHNKITSNGNFIILNDNNWVNVEKKDALRKIAQHFRTVRTENCSPPKLTFTRPKFPNCTKQSFPSSTRLIRLSTKKFSTYSKA